MFAWATCERKPEDNGNRVTSEEFRGTLKVFGEINLIFIAVYTESCLD